MKLVGTSVFHKAQGQIQWEIFWQFPAPSAFCGMQIENLLWYPRKLHKHVVLPQRTHTIKYYSKCNSTCILINWVSIILAAIRQYCHVRQCHLRHSSTSIVSHDACGRILGIPAFQDHTSWGYFYWEKHKSIPQSGTSVIGQFVQCSHWGLQPSHRACEDFHRVLRLQPLGSMPNWKWKTGVYSF